MPPKVIFPAVIQEADSPGCNKEESAQHEHERFNRHAINLDRILNPETQDQKWNIAVSDIRLLKQSLDDCIDYLRVKAENYERDTRNVEAQLITVHGNKSLSGFHRSIYKPLENKLLDEDVYTPVFDYGILTD